jgi:hypothetical protein
MNAGILIITKEGQVPPSTSLIVRGNSIKDSDEGEVPDCLYSY